MQNRLQNWLLKRIHREETSTLTANRIYILPTREGIIYSLLILVMLAAAINFNNSLVFFFTFLMVGMGIISMHMTQQNLLKLQLTIAHVPPVFCRQNLSLPLILLHKKNPVTNIDIDHHSIAVQLWGKDLLLTDVFNNEKSILQLHCPTTQRGNFKLPALTISSRYPLGLFRAWSNVKLHCNAIVYPGQSINKTYQPKSGAGSDGISPEGRGFDDFSGFKSYQQGDSLKHIHWKAYAREQGLLSKTFSGSTNHEYWLDYNELSGDTESRLSQLCYLIVQAEQKGDRYGLILSNKTIQISQGQKHQHQCLKALALF
ncbi:MAG: DUF58 domain-containing protein [gamma proteobacterium symbiont of Taylorina sp.]|nr:DUF58 domain-containing protein [gamma proteobacterium symbiont of Taylorina sp.]